MDREILTYFFVPTYVFDVIIISQALGYAGLYFKWLSYPILAEDVWRPFVGDGGVYADVFVCIASCPSTRCTSPS